MPECALQKEDFVLQLILVMVGYFPHARGVNLHGRPFNTDNITDWNKFFLLAINAIESVFIKTNPSHDKKQKGKQREDQETQGVQASAL